MKKLILAYVALCLCGITPVAANKIDTVRVNVEFDASLATNPSIRPMWSWSQSWGRYTRSGRAEALVRANASCKLLDGKVGSLIVGTSLQASTDLSRMMVDEAYLKGKLWQFDYTLGYNAFTPIDQFNGLSLGSYLMSDNARTVPKVGAGFFDWWAVPGLKHWLELKGGIYFGLMPDTGGAIQHEKFLYVRIGGLPVKPYIGLVHSALMGGKTSDGVSIPIDFWSTFFAKSSSKLNDAGFGGEYLNAAGAHQGMWDLGICFETSLMDGSVWYRRPFADSRAINLFKFAECRDIILGVDLKFRNFKHIREFCFEFMNTEWQGGPGLADPNFISTGPEKTGEAISLSWQGMTKENIHRYFSSSTIREWESAHGELSDFNSCYDFFKHYTNQDYEFGGRSTYLYNYLYPNGWIVNGQTSGSAPFLTDTVMSCIAPASSFNNRIPGMRFRSFNAGVSGDILPKLSYRFKCTLTRYKGNWNDYYDSPSYSWKLTENYYFADPKWELSTGLWLDLKATEKMSVFASLFADFGQMYNSTALRAGIRYYIIP